VSCFVAPNPEGHILTMTRGCVLLRRGISCGGGGVIFCLYCGGGVGGGLMGLFFLFTKNVKFMWGVGFKRVWGWFCKEGRVYVCKERF